MIFSLAPMEGITGHVFRRVHAEVFGKMDRYYTPFVTPSRQGTPLGKRYRVELDPRNNCGLDVVPQVLTKNADDFVWVSEQLEQLGYREVNLNLGCPSGTVTAKGKGSGATPTRWRGFCWTCASARRCRSRSRRAWALRTTASTRTSCRSIAAARLPS